MTEIKKGTEVWLFGSWDHKATFCIERLVIQSKGKQQATATKTESGKFIKRQIWAPHYSNMISVADLPDPTQEGLRRAAEYKAMVIQGYVNCAHRESDDGSESTERYFKYAKKECEAILAAEPAVKFI